MRARVSGLYPNYPEDFFEEGAVMPTYEYHCNACHTNFSLRERMDEHAAGGTVCPNCKSRDVERVMSGFYARTPRKS